MRGSPHGGYIKNGHTGLKKYTSKYISQTELHVVFYYHQQMDQILGFATVEFDMVTQVSRHDNILSK